MPIAETNPASSSHPLLYQQKTTQATFQPNQMNLSSNTLSSNTAPAAKPSTAHHSGAAAKLNVIDVTMHFGREYYTMLSREPERLHCFYSKQSSLLHAEEDDLETSVCVGLEEINQRIIGMGFGGARVVVSSIDCQPSMNGGILVTVVGSMHMRSGTVKKFIQTFFLAEQPNGYFVLNDILRFLSPQENLLAPSAPAISSPITPEETTRTIHQQQQQPSHQYQQPQQPVVSPQPEPKEEPVTAPAATTPVKSSTSASKTVKPAGKGKRESAVEAPQTPSAAEETAAAADTTTSSPSSWAALAAVQQNKWGSGVVATAKGPVVSVAVEEDSGKQSFSNNNNNNNNRVNYRTGNNRRPSGRRESNSDQPTDTPADQQRPKPQRNSAYVPKTNYDPSKSLYISGLKGDVDREQLRAVFLAVSTSSKLVSFEVVPTKGIAFVEYDQTEAANAALSAGLHYNGHPMQVELRRAPKTFTNFRPNDRPGGYQRRQSPGVGHRRQESSEEGQQ